MKEIMRWFWLSPSARRLRFAHLFLGIVWRQHWGGRCTVRDALDICRTMEPKS